jgi:hypothetical protein
MRFGKLPPEQPVRVAVLNISPGVVSFRHFLALKVEGAATEESDGVCYMGRPSLTSAKTLPCAQDLAPLGTDIAEAVLLTG